MPNDTGSGAAVFSAFFYDSAVFTAEQSFTAFEYDENWGNRYVLRQRELCRVHLAVMLDEAPIGEIILKKIHQPQGSCTLSIHLQNDSVKNCGFGTQAEQLVLRYAFDELHLETVYADTLQTNTRSQHVLQCVGFEKTGEDDVYVYYRCDTVKD